MINLKYLNLAFANIDKTWQNILYTKCGHSLQTLDESLNIIQHSDIIYPPRQDIFNALKYTKIDNIKVVILGQDPYHGEHEANGLAFAVNEGIKIPPSLQNIFKELSNEYKKNTNHCNGKTLENWAEQGVLLLNNTLTVIKDKANSMANIGWDFITNSIIQELGQNQKHIAFMLWGKFAQQKKTLINNQQNLILETSHPSPLSAHRGFLGCNHFIKANHYLITHYKQPINWIT